MAFDIITIEPTTVDGAHAAGDVFFNLKKFQIPARACKVINVFMEVANGGGEDDTKLGLLFFQKKAQSTLGTLDDTANISHADFTSNQYIGQCFLSLTDGSNLALDLIDTTALYYSCNAFKHAADTKGAASAEPVVLKGDAGSSTIFMGGVVHHGAPDFDGTANLKIHLHVEY